MRSSNVPEGLISCNDDPICNVSADVTTNEFRTNNSALSVWQINSISDLDEAALAISMGSQNLEATKLIFFDAKKLSDSPLVLRKSQGVTAVPDLVNTHRDICEITHAGLDVLLRIYVDSVNNKNWKQYRKSELSEIIKRALNAGRIDSEQINDRLKQSIEKIA